MNSSEATDDGLLFGPTDSGKMYKSVYYHRGSGSSEHKSEWCIPPNTEYEIFCDADNGNWKDHEEHYWGIYERGLSIIGKAGERLCKFPRNSNPNNPWHGFPVSPQRNIKHSPPPEFVQSWIDNNIIEKRIGRNIQRRKI